MIRFNLQMGDFIGKINKSKREYLFIYLFYFIFKSFSSPSHVRRVGNRAFPTLLVQNYFTVDTPYQHQVHMYRSIYVWSSKNFSTNVAWGWRNTQCDSPGIFFFHLNILPGFPHGFSSTVPRLRWSMFTTRLPTTQMHLLNRHNLYHHSS